MKTNVKRILLLLILIADMVFIFYNSAQVASVSSNASQSVTQMVAHVIVPNYDKLDETAKLNTVASLEAIVREAAHLLQFVPMGFALYLLLCISTLPKNLSRIRLLLTLGFGILYAVSDEVHQLFVPGRSFQFFDIFMDTCGIAFGCICGVALLTAAKLLSDKKDIIPKTSS